MQTLASKDHFKRTLSESQQPPLRFAMAKVDSDCSPRSKLAGVRWGRFVRNPGYIFRHSFLNMAKEVKLNGRRESHLTPTHVIFIQNDINHDEEQIDEAKKICSPPSRLEQRREHRPSTLLIVDKHKNSSRDTTITKAKSLATMTVPDLVASNDESILSSALEMAQSPSSQSLHGESSDQQRRELLITTPSTTALEASSDIVRALFGSSVGPCWGDYFCTHNRIRGRLYTTSTAVLFYSNLLGFERRIMLRFNEIVEIRLIRTTSIEIAMFDGEVYVFRSFNDRLQVLHKLKGLKILDDRKNLRFLSGNSTNETETAVIRTAALSPDSVPIRARFGSGESHEDPLVVASGSHNGDSAVAASSPARPQSLRPILKTSPRMAMEHQRQFSSTGALLSNRRRAVSDSVVRTITFSPEKPTRSQRGSPQRRDHGETPMGTPVRSTEPQNGLRESRTMDHSILEDNDGTPNGQQEQQRVATAQTTPDIQTAWNKLTKGNSEPHICNFGIQVRTDIAKFRLSLLFW